MTAGGSFAFNPEETDGKEIVPSARSNHVQGPNSSDDCDNQKDNKAQGSVSVNAEIWKNLPSVLIRLIAKHVANAECLNGKNPSNVALVCKNFLAIVVSERQVVHSPCWKEWYGVIGNEETYERFLNCDLEYRPNPRSDVGMKVISIRDFPNPLDGEFNLKDCGKAGQVVSIMTGLRTGKNPANHDKLEIWVTPKFLAVKKRGSSARHLLPIMDSWNNKVGLFFTEGDWEDNVDYDYVTSEDLDMISQRSIPENWLEAAPLHNPDFCRVSVSALEKMHAQGNFKLVFKPK